MLLRIFSIVFPIFAIVAVGYLYARLKKPDIAFANQLNMDVFIPALLFSVLSSKNFDITAYQLIALGALLIIVGVALDTVVQVQQHLHVRHYDDYMKQGRVKFRGRRRYM